MNPVIKRTQRDYSLAFKLTLVDQIEKGEMTHKQAQDRYGIQGRSTVLCWLRKHGQLDWSLGTPPIPITRGHLMSDKPLPQTPEQRIKELEQQLAQVQQKADFFEAVNLKQTSQTSCGLPTLLTLPPGQALSMLPL